MPNPNDIALNLARMRVEHDLSQEGLANTLGLSRQAVSKWERGESVPDLGNLMALSDLYAVTIDELVRGPKEYEGADAAHSHDDEAAETDDLQPAEDGEAFGESAEANAFEASEVAETPEAPARFWQRWPRTTVIAAALGCLLVCALICGFVFVMLRDDGSPTPVAGKTAQQIAQEVAQETDLTEYNGRLMRVAEEQFDPQAVSSFHIDWYNGQARLLVSGEGVAADMITVRESSTMPLGDDERMQCRLKEGTLEVTSVNAGLLLDAPQHVDIYVPPDVAKAFTNVTLSGLASEYSVEGITCTNLQVNLPSDTSSVRMANVQVENLGLNKSGRGNAVLEGSFEYIQVGQTSGAIKITDAIQPNALQATVYNGDLAITLPKDSAFALAADVSGGLISCDFPQYGTTTLYSGVTEKEVEAISYTRPGTTTPLYHLTARTSHITIAPSE